MGAAGLTCSTAEMGGRGGVGIEIELDLVPQREDGMTPEEIMLSESQERMLLVAQRGREGAVLDVFSRWGLDAVEIGTVTGDRLLRVRHHGAVVAELGNDFLSEDAPMYDRPFTAPRRTAPLDGPDLPEASGAELLAGLETLLATPDLGSKRWIWEQYDYQVRTNTTAGPGGDAAVIRIKEAGVSLAMSLDGNSRYCVLDPRLGAQLIVAECCRNLATVGAEPIAATNNLNFGNPEKSDIMAQLVEAIEGLGDACRHFGTPITGGNVSFYNETLGQGVNPSPVVGIVGIVEHVNAPVGPCFTAPGHKVILIGGVLPAAGDQLCRRFGSSHYARTVLGRNWGLPPALDADYESAVQEATRRIVRRGLAHSVHDVADGGLAVALAECCFGPAPVGARVDLKTELPPLHALFHEAPSRVLLAVSPKDAAEVIRIAADLGAGALIIGETAGTTLAVRLNGTECFEAPLARLHLLWDTAFEGRLEVQ
jgi:phosphoribosylformylglycinamidine synthase